MKKDEKPSIDTGFPPFWMQNHTWVFFFVLQEITVGTQISYQQASYVRSQKKKDNIQHPKNEAFASKNKRGRRPLFFPYSVFPDSANASLTLSNNNYQLCLLEAI